MRILIAIGLAAVAAAPLAACNKSGGAPAGSTAVGPLTQIPQRKPGLWKQTMVLDGAPSGGGAFSAWMRHVSAFFMSCRFIQFFEDAERALVHSVFKFGASYGGISSSSSSVPSTPC